MRMLLDITIPHEPFNTLVRNGTIDEKMKNILADLKPEAVYFSEYDGMRGAVIVVNVPDAASIPAIAEPWFLTFEADVMFRIAMTPDDLAKSGLEKLGKKWG